MSVTRLKRKDRRNKTVSRLEVQFLKLATNLELGSRSKEKKSSTYTHELVDGATDVPHKFFEGDWVTVRGFVSRLELALPLMITRPLGMRT